MSESVLIWLKKDIEGTYFVYGTYFFNKKMGDIPAYRRYSKKESNLKSIIEGYENHLPLSKLRSRVISKAKELGFKPKIELVL